MAVYNNGKFISKRNKEITNIPSIIPHPLHSSRGENASMRAWV
jgi:hypothetical protein